MIGRLYGLGARHRFVMAALLGGLGNAVLWVALSGNVRAGLPGIPFGMLIGFVIKWSIETRDRRDASKRREPSLPIETLAAEEVAVMEEYWTADSHKWRRWTSWLLLPAGAVAGFIVSYFLFDEAVYRVAGVVAGINLGTFVAVRWFSAESYLKSKNPVGRPQY